MINLPLAVAGEYRLEKSRSGIVTGDSGWVKNLITNQGMNNLGTSSSTFSHCHVGTGSAAPTFSDTALQTFRASASGPSSTVTIDTAGRYWIATYAYSFPAGSASGNLTEIGAGTAASGTVLSSRALIKDAQGNPVAFPVLPDEDLAVRFRFKVKQPTVDFTATVAGKNITIRAARVDNTGSTDGWGLDLDPFTCLSSASAAVAYSGAIGSITGSPAGLLGGVPSNLQTNAPYIAGSHRREGSYLFSASQGNGNILSFQWRHGVGCWQMQMDSPITKVSPLTFRLGVATSWARE